MLSDRSTDAFHDLISHDSRSSEREAIQVQLEVDDGQNEQLAAIVSVEATADPISKHTCWYDDLAL
jgi:hypothetical protein